MDSSTALGCFSNVVLQERPGARWKLTALCSQRHWRMTADGPFYVEKYVKCPDALWVLQFKWVYTTMPMLRQTYYMKKTFCLNYGNWNIFTIDNLDGQTYIQRLLSILLADYWANERYGIIHIKQLCIILHLLRLDETVNSYEAAQIKHRNGFLSVILDLINEIPILCTSLFCL